MFLERHQQGYNNRQGYKGRREGTEEEITRCHGIANCPPLPLSLFCTLPPTFIKVASAAVFPP